MDAITLTTTAWELRETVLGGRVQAIIPPDEHGLALELYTRGARHWLLLDANPRRPRLHLLTEKARRGLETDTPFLLLVRKWLDGARLTEVFQPAWERVLFLTFTHPGGERMTLAAEVMGRWSNVLLLDADGLIRAGLRRFERAGARPPLPGRPYVPPPPQAGKLPLDLFRQEDAEHLLGTAPSTTPIWRLLVEKVAGLSPLLARELVFRAVGDAQATPNHPNATPEALLNGLDWIRRLAREGGWAPSVALDPTTGTPLAFAPYELTHLGSCRLYPSLSQAAVAFYTAALGADAYAGRRARVQALLTAARERLQARHDALNAEMARAAEAETWRRWGEWILAYASTLPAGAAELVVETGAETLTIPLDPTLSAVANAQAYFNRYHKARRALDKLPGLLAEVERDMAYLDQLQADLDLADHAGHLEDIRQALLATGLVRSDRRPQRRPSASQPLRLRSRDGFEVLIGRHALQNERVTWELAGPDDLWLHTERVPGAHVVIRTHGRPVPTTTLEEAAGWAAYYSAARRDTRVGVLYTQRRHLRRIPGGRPGQVRVLRAQSLWVAPTPPSPSTKT